MQGNTRTKFKVCWKFETRRADNLTLIPRNKTVKIQADPQADKDLTNSTKLRNELRTRLRNVQEKKPDRAIYQSRGSHE